MISRSLVLELALWLGLVCVAAVPCPATEPSNGQAAIEVTVHVTAIADSTVPVETARLTIEPTDAPAFEPVETVLSLTEGTGQAMVPLDPRHEWRIQASAEGVWSPATNVSPGSDPSAFLLLFPAAAVNAKLVPPDEETSIPGVVFHLAKASEGNPRLPETLDTECAVEQQKVADCRLPAGRWHVRVDVAGFASSFFWDQQLTAGETLDLNELALRRGGSVWGRVETTEGPADPRSAAVELRPVLGDRPMTQEQRRRLEQLTSEAGVNPWGYFQFVGIDPGAYRVVARQPGYVDAVKPWLQVDESGDTELDEALILRPPARLSVLVAPAEGPLGKPWELRLHENSGSEVLNEIAAGRTGPAGAWSSPPAYSAEGERPFRVMVNGWGVGA